MKRKLASDQFVKRLTPPPKEVLAAVLEEYASDLLSGENASNILLTEIPLRLTEIKETKGGKEVAEHVALVLTGYRIYQVRKSNPDNPVLHAIYSKLTRKWHRVGYVDGLPGAFGSYNSYTCDGCYALGEVAWTKTPQPVGDSVLRQCLLLDLVERPSSSYHLRWALHSEGAGRRRYIIGSLVGHSSADDPCPEAPDAVLLLRDLRRNPEAFENMQEVVDKWGMPDGLLGEVFRLVDSFRTF